MVRVPVAGSIVTPFSVLLFHPMRWQSEESVQLSEAIESALFKVMAKSPEDRFNAGEQFVGALREIQEMASDGQMTPSPGFDFLALGRGPEKAENQDEGNREGAFDQRPAQVLKVFEERFYGAAAFLLFADRLGFRTIDVDG